MTMRLLITGAGGFVGAHLARGLADLGYDVLCLDCAFSARVRQRLSGLVLVEDQITPACLTTLAARHGRFDALIHGAALTTPAQDTTRLLRRNLELGLDCLEFAGDLGIPVFVLLSSSGVFAFDEAAVLTEATPPTGQSAYGLSKRALEMVLPSFARRSLALRLGPVYGPHETRGWARQRLSPVAEFLAAAQSGQDLRVATPMALRDWTFAPDLAPALARVLDSDLTGVVHLTSGHAISDASLAERIAANFPGACVQWADDQTPRAPMASTWPAVTGFGWTPLDQGLQATQRMVA